MFSVAPNILLAPNMTQNAERKHRTQNTNTAHNRPHLSLDFITLKALFESLFANQTMIVGFRMEMKEFLGVLTLSF